MSRLLLALSVAGLTTTNALTQNSIASRRAFVAKVGSAATMGWLVNLEMPHSDRCQCGQCSSAHTEEQCNACCMKELASHGAACQCGSCALSFRPAAAMAYERDVGDASRSPEQAAFNIQARETNARLEREGFKLDTKEEEASRLSGALASFSYDASTPKQSTGRGSANKKSSTSEKK